MFTEYEIDTMMEIPEVLEETLSLKKEFLKAEAPYLEINEHDFFSLVMMAPTIGIAMADGKISLFEEISLNKKARKLSLGGYFFKKDPVVDAMRFLVKNYDEWSDKFYRVLQVTLDKVCDIASLQVVDEESEGVDYERYKKEVLHTPYILIRFISSFFLKNDEDIINKNHRIKKSEYKQMLIIGGKIGLDRLNVFHMFCRTFKSE